MTIYLSEQPKYSVHVHMINHHFGNSIELLSHLTSIGKIWVLVHFDVPAKQAVYGSSPVSFSFFVLLLLMQLRSMKQKSKKMQRVKS